MSVCLSVVLNFAFLSCCRPACSGSTFHNFGAILLKLVIPVSYTNVSKQIFHFRKMTARGRCTGNTCQYGFFDHISITMNFSYMCYSSFCSSASSLQKRYLQLFSQTCHFVSMSLCLPAVHNFLLETRTCVHLQACMPVCMHAFWSDPGKWTNPCFFQHAL